LLSDRSYRRCRACQGFYMLGNKSGWYAPNFRVWVMNESGGDQGFRMNGLVEFLRTLWFLKKMTTDTFHYGEKWISLISG
jgi:hypothetical protein